MKRKEKSECVHKEAIKQKPLFIKRFAIFSHFEISSYCLPVPPSSPSSPSSIPISVFFFLFTFLLQFFLCFSSCVWRFAIARSILTSWIICTKNYHHHLVKCKIENGHEIKEKYNNQRKREHKRLLTLVASAVSI